MHSPKISKLPKLVLVRHGQSVWNLDKRFTGWQDVPLSAQGREEATRAGKALRRFGLGFEAVFTSVLCRATETFELMSRELGCEGLAPVRAWQLNERHYGALTGLGKSETAAEFGADAVRRWRRQFDTLPPQMSPDDPRAPHNDPLYAHLPRELLPLGESLRTTGLRTLPFFRQNVLTEIAAGRNVLVVAHNHSLRSIIKDLDAISDADIAELTIETGQPIVYEMALHGGPVRSFAVQVGVEEELRARPSFALDRNF